HRIPGHLQTWVDPYHAIRDFSHHGVGLGCGRGSMRHRVPSGRSSSVTPSPARRLRTSSAKAKFFSWRSPGRTSTSSPRRTPPRARPEGWPHSRGMAEKAKNLAQLLENNHASPVLVQPVRSLPPRFHLWLMSEAIQGVDDFVEFAQSPASVEVVIHG